MAEKILFAQAAGQIYDAVDFRRLTQAIFGGPGAVRLQDCKVVVSSPPAMTVTVKAGTYLLDVDTGTNEGLYTYQLDVDELDYELDDADPSNGRKDLVGLLVVDSEHDGGGDVNGDIHPVLHVVTGTPSGSPAEPTAPDNFRELAMVTVDAAVTSIASNKITDRRTFIPQEFQASPQTVTWSNHTADADLDSVTFGPYDWSVILTAVVELYVNPNDSDTWDCAFEVWDGAGGTGTKYGVGAMRNSGANLRKQVIVHCDEVVIDVGDTVELFLRANYSTATPGTGHTPSALGNNRVLARVRPYGYKLL